MKLKTVRGVGGLCGEEMVASKGNFQCEVCFRDGITTKSNLKRHQRFYCKGGARVVPLTVDMKVVKVSEEEVIVSTEEAAEERSSCCVHCCHDFHNASNAQKHCCPLAPDLDPNIPVLNLLSSSDSEQFKVDHRGNTLAQVGKVFHMICSVL